MKPVRTLVLLANDGTARLLVNEGVGKGLARITSLDADQAIRAEAHEFADDPGRSSAAPGMARHAYAPHADEEEQKRAAFAAAVIGLLDGQWRKERYDRLVIAAPPKMLGELRDRLGELAARLHGDLAKDLTKAPVAKLPGHFADIAAF